MMMWKYRGVRDEERLRRLQTWVPFEDLIAQLKREMEIVCCHTRDCNDEPGYKRTIYCVELRAELFDMFFNSQCGYRGGYFESPQRGLSANALLLATLRPKLLDWMRVHCMDQDPEFAAKSISSPSAKAWLAEEPLRVCERCEGEWNTSIRAALQIVNGRWEVDAHVEAEWGRQAHLFRKLRFIGAFLNNAGEEYVAPHKKGRAEAIWAHGWS
jgi:hypothetical protein